MFEIPGSNIVSVHVTGEAVRGEAPPIYIHGAPLEEQQPLQEDELEEEQAFAAAK